MKDTEKSSLQLILCLNAKIKCQNFKMLGIKYFIFFKQISVSYKLSLELHICTPLNRD